MTSPECKNYVKTLSTTKMVADRLKVIPRWVNFLAHELDLGMTIGHIRLFDEDDIKQMQIRRATTKYGKGRAPKPTTPPAPTLKLSPAYQEELARLRGERKQ